MHELADAQLLRAYAQQGDQAAFRELVTRYSDLVYSAALRQVNSPDPARDIAQSVFTDLALKARTLADKLPTDGSLAGWLHRSTRFAVLNLLRDVRRRRENERQAMEQLRTNSEPEPEWDGIRPVLDEALDSLNDEDRDALLLRFFKNHDFRTIGAALGVSDDTAQKRVSRALDRLRAEFNRRGVTTSAVALMAALSANAVAAGPAGLAATLSTAALTGTTATITTATLATHTTMHWLNIKSITAIVAAALTAGTGTFLVQHGEGSRLRKTNQNLIAQQDKLTSERDAALSVVAANNDEIERLRKDKSELLRLRGEVGVLRRQTNGLGKAREENQLLGSKPIVAQRQKVLSPEEVRNACNNYLRQIDAAMNQYALDNRLSDKHILTAEQIVPYLVGKVILRCPSGGTYTFGRLDNAHRPSCSVQGHTFASDPNQGDAPVILPVAVRGELVPVLEAYMDANNHMAPQDLEELKPYITTPEQQAALDRKLTIKDVFNKAGNK